MPFTRHLDPKFIEHLNGLYNEEGSWWRELVDDPEVFIGVRDKGLNAYVGGASVARVNWNGKKPTLKVHVKYLVFANDVQDPKNYCDLLKGESPKPVIVSNVADYVRAFSRIKKAAKSLSGQERQAENSIASKHKCVLDIEAVFNTKAESQNEEENAAGGSHGRVDLVASSIKGCLSFVELKLFENDELRSSEVDVAAVCHQLVDYGNWLNKHGQAILKAYQEAYDCITSLQGEFFAERKKRTRPSQIDPVPRLLVVGFARADVSETKALQIRIVEAVKKNIPGFNKTHVRTLGSVTSIGERHLV